MMSNPTEDEICQVIEITGLDINYDRDLIIQALKSNSRSIETVINEFFNGADGFRTKYTTKWDESMFAGDRDGGRDDMGGSLHVEAPNQTSQNDVIYGTDPSADTYVGAPSRPPSRTNQQSSRNNITDWAASDSRDVPKSYAQEEEEMERALRESAVAAGMEVPEQETGVVSTTAPETQHFGPANRDDYEEARWAMIPLDSEPREPQLSAASRKRDDGAPAFLATQSAWPGHRLGGFLTILHEIPLARNMLLQAGKPAASYGYSSQWWTGQEILIPGTLAQRIMEQPLVDEDQRDGPQLDGSFEMEIHRLMAFLDLTERSYGSANVLANIVDAPWASMERQFYEHFGARNEKEIAPFYTTVVVTSVGDAGEEDEEQEFGLVELQNPRSDFESITSVYELLDQVMWSDMIGHPEVEEQARMAVFRGMGDIFPISIGGDGPGQEIDIPEELYPERWIESRKEEAIRIQKGLRRTETAVRKTQEAKTAYYKFQDHETGLEHDRRNIAVRARQGLREYYEYLEARGRFRTAEESGLDGVDYPDYQTAPPSLTEEEEELQKILRRGVDVSDNMLLGGSGQLSGPDEELNRLQARKKFLRRLLTDPNKAGRPRPMECKKYLLQGITTLNDTVYVCRRTGGDLIELDDAPKARDQWWRLSYNPHDQKKPGTAEKLDFHEVVKRVWKETKTPFLVYASENAIYSEPAPLSPALERFVKTDNRAFRREQLQEANEESSNFSREPASGGMKSPGKRKHRADSTDSMDSNRVSVGSEVGTGTGEPLGGADAESATPLDAEQQVESSPAAPNRPPPLPKRHSPSDKDQPGPDDSQMSLGSGAAPQAEMLEKRAAVSQPGADDVDRSPEMQERFQMPTLRRFLTGEGQSGDKMTGDMELDGSP